MQIDVCEQLAIIARQAHDEITAVLTAVCLAALGVIGGAAFLRYACGPALDAVRAFCRSPRAIVEKFAVALCVCGISYYGATKGMVWTRVQNDGGDAALQVLGIYTAISNAVTEVGGIPVTNEVPMVAVNATGAISVSTPVWFRMSDTNEWALAAKTAPTYHTDGVTNRIEFATSDNFAGYTYWWAGVDTPAVIRPTEGIKVTGYTACGTNVVFTFTCDDPNCTTFEAKWKYKTEADEAFRTAATSSASPIVVPGFWVGTNVDWRITSSYLEDGE